MDHGSQVEMPRKCDFCGEMYRHFSGGIPLCDPCAECYFEETFPPEALYGCDRCEEKFVTDDALQEHFLSCSSENEESSEDEEPIVEPTFRCRLCKKMILSELLLFNHYIDHALGKFPVIEKEETIFECDICKETFTHKKYLRYHIERHSWFKCVVDGCTNSFFRKKQLVLHRKRHFIIPKRYICHFCNYEFKFGNAKILELHEKTHTGENPYKCDFCISNFKDLSALNIHRSYHSDEYLERFGHY